MLARAGMGVVGRSSCLSGWTGPTEAGGSTCGPAEGGEVDWLGVVRVCPLRCLVLFVSVVVGVSGTLRAAWSVVFGW